MVLPSGVSEADFLEAVERSLALLAQSFVFGVYSLEDVRQEGFLYATQLMAAGRYDPSRPLGGFVYTHLRNRFCNLVRDEYWRNDPPCRGCHRGDPCGPGGVCRRYAAWAALYQAKANVATPLGMDHASDERDLRADGAAERAAEAAEVLARVDAGLPAELRADYLRMRAGERVPKARRLLVERAVVELAGGAVDRCPSLDD